MNFFLVPATFFSFCELFNLCGCSFLFFKINSVQVFGGKVSQETQGSNKNAHASTTKESATTLDSQGLSADRESERERVNHTEAETHCDSMKLRTTVLTDRLCAWHAFHRPKKKLYQSRHHKKRVPLTLCYTSDSVPSLTVEECDNACVSRCTGCIFQVSSMSIL